MKYFIPCLIFGIIVTTLSCNNGNEKQQTPQAAIDTTLKLPDGFTASVFADSLGSTRHIAFDNNGDIYVRLGGLNPSCGN